MSNDLVKLYQQIQETPALSVDFPEETGKGHITRLDTNAFSLSSWNMEFTKDTFVEGNVPNDVRLLFCSGDGVEWVSDRGPMHLDNREACFCFSDGSIERMCYQAGSLFSFFSVSIPANRFAGIIESYFSETDGIIDMLPGRSFMISATLQKSLHDIGSLESIHSGFELMRLEGCLLENLSLCLQSALCEPIRYRRLHQDDLCVVRGIGKRIEEDPVFIPDIATLARECCMSVSKLTRAFRQVYGISLHAYVIEARLQKGAELLLHDRISVKEIAERLGYMKPSQFSSDFRKRYGILPGEYRSCMQLA